MSWNYRIVRTKMGPEIEYSIREVFYDDDGKLTGYTENPASVVTYEGEWDDNDRTPEDSLRWHLNQMLMALEKPIIEAPEEPTNKKSDIWDTLESLAGTIDAPSNFSGGLEQENAELRAKIKSLKEKLNTNEDTLH